MLCACCTERGSVSRSTTPGPSVPRRVVKRKKKVTKVAKSSPAAAANPSAYQAATVAVVRAQATRAVPIVAVAAAPVAPKPQLSASYIAATTVGGVGPVTLVGSGRPVSNAPLQQQLPTIASPHRPTGSSSGNAAVAIHFSPPPLSPSPQRAVVVHHQPASPSSFERGMGANISEFLAAHNRRGNLSSEFGAFAATAGLDAHHGRIFSCFEGGLLYRIASPLSPSEPIWWFLYNDTTHWLAHAEYTFDFGKFLSSRRKGEVAETGIAAAQLADVFSRSVEFGPEVRLTRTAPGVVTCTCSVRPGETGFVLYFGLQPTVVDATSTTSASVTAAFVAQMLETADAGLIEVPSAKPSHTQHTTGGANGPYITCHFSFAPLEDAERRALTEAALAPMRGELAAVVRLLNGGVTEGGRKATRSTAEDLLHLCLKHRYPFVDIEFAPSPHAIWRLGGSGSATSDSTSRYPQKLPITTWTRLLSHAEPPRAGGGGALVTKSAHGGGGLVAGTLGDTGFVSALAAIAERRGHVASVLAGGPRAAAEREVGAIRAILNLDGWWRSILVDSYVPGVLSVRRPHRDPANDAAATTRSASPMSPSPDRRRMLQGIADGPAPLFAHFKATPKDDSGEASTTPPAAASSVDQAQWWVAAVEKAYAKGRGSFAAIEGGDPMEPLQDLTGCPTARFDRVWNAAKAATLAGRRSDSLYNDTPVAALFQQLRAYLEDANNIVLLTTPGANAQTNGEFAVEHGALDSDALDAAYRAAGLHLAHGYTLLDVKEFAIGDTDSAQQPASVGAGAKVTAAVPLRLLCFRNPFSTEASATSTMSPARGSRSSADPNEWRGAWSHGSPLWARHPAIAAACGVTTAATSADPSTVWMAWEDALRFFDAGGVCFDRPTWSDYRVRGSFDLTSGGTPSVALEVSVRDRAVKVLLTLSQQDTRTLPSFTSPCDGPSDSYGAATAIGGPQKQCALMLALAGPDPTRAEPTRVQVVACTTADVDRTASGSSPTFAYSRDVGLIATLLPSPRPYLIVPRIYETRHSGSDQNGASDTSTATSKQYVLGVISEIPVAAPPSSTSGVAAGTPAAPTRGGSSNMTIRFRLLHPNARLFQNHSSMLYDPADGACSESARAPFQVRHARGAVETWEGEQFR